MRGNEIKQMFNQVYNNQKNFMTPHVLKYATINETLMYELSEGEFMGKILYGFTVISIDKLGNPTKTHELSKCFQPNISYADIQLGNNIEGIHYETYMKILDYIKEIKRGVTLNVRNIREYNR